MENGLWSFVLVCYNLVKIYKCRIFNVFVCMYIFVGVFVLCVVNFIKYIKWVVIIYFFFYVCYK